MSTEGFALLGAVAAANVAALWFGWIYNRRRRQKDRPPVWDGVERRREGVSRCALVGGRVCYWHESPLTFKQPAGRPPARGIWRPCRRKGA